MTEVVIAHRYCGPPESGNGGYSCGCVAHALGESARVRLHRPPPLDRPLQLERVESEARLLDGETVIAAGVPATVAMDPPAIPSLDDARAATARYIGGPDSAHPFPTCFVCGPARREGDGLRIFAGAIGEGVVAAPFEPSADLLDAEGHVRSEIVWSALDCPGYFAIVGGALQPMLLGELTVALRAPVGAGPHVVVGWPLGVEGRKARCGTAIASGDGEVLAIGLATWIRIA